MPTGNWEIPNFTDSERLKTPKMNCVLKFTKTKNSISLDSRFVDLENTGEHAALKHTYLKHHLKRCSQARRDLASLKCV